MTKFKLYTVEDHNVEKIKAIRINSSAHESVSLVSRLGSRSTNLKQDEFRHVAL